MIRLHDDQSRAAGIGQVVADPITGHSVNLAQSPGRGDAPASRFTAARIARVPAAFPELQHSPRRGATSLSSLPVRTAACPPRAPRAALARSLRGIQSPTKRTSSASKTWGTRQFAQRVDLASQALRRRTGRSLKALVRHVQLLWSNGTTTSPNRRRPGPGPSAADPGRRT